ncbi:MAG: D-Ala-D-Ala carboxypeptidase family metallohydrolase, partial [Nannocystaceae bacterium]
TLTAGLGACVVEADGRDETRGSWQSGEAEGAETCAGVCGDQAAAGCWCDEQCAEYGDCCPDKVAVCDGAGGPGASGEPGAALGSFELTYYWVTEESAFGGADSVSLYDDSCSVLAQVPQGFADAITLEGTGRLTDGTVLNYWGSCDCPRSPCFFEVDATHPWGHGVQNRALQPFRSVAVDKDVVAYGTKLYIEQFDGVQMPGEAPWGGFVHDGCVSADDTGSAIVGKHLDFFSARRDHYVSLNAVLGVSDVTVREGGDRCSGAGAGGGDGAGGDAPPPPGGGGAGGDLCFPGPSGDGSVCVDLVDAASVGSGYGYPSPLSGNVNYRAPVRYIDLEAVSGDLSIAANFTLSEVAQSWKGRYAVVQPHAVARLQGLRNALGAIKVNSGYRSPSYNASVDGATHSRHMYGDAFDLDPLSASLSQLESACSSNGGMLVEYTSHVHCDWRYDPVDTALFGTLSVGTPPPLPLADSALSAHLQQLGGEWLAPAEGFDEGEPMRRWTARDAEGQVLAEALGERFVPPAGAVTLEVLVGAQIELTTDL